MHDKLFRPGKNEGKTLVSIHFYTYFLIILLLLEHQLSSLHHVCVCICMFVAHFVVCFVRAGFGGIVNYTSTKDEAKSFFII
jgi:hypothetical protein